MQTITAEQIKDELLPTPVFLLDRVYGVVNHKYLASTFIPWFRDWCFASGLHYASEARDCDKFSRAFVAQAHFAAWRRQTPHTGAVGWMVVPGHSLNLARTEAGWLEIEPQTGELRPLRDSGIEYVVL